MASLARTLGTFFSVRVSSDAQWAAALIAENEDEAENEDDDMGMELVI